MIFIRFFGLSPENRTDAFFIFSVINSTDYEPECLMLAAIPAYFELNVIVFCPPEDSDNKNISLKIRSLYLFMIKIMFLV